MIRNKRAYKVLESTQSFCPECEKKVNAKIILKNNEVFLLKFCKEHGFLIDILEHDANYYLKRNKYLKPGTISKVQTNIIKGCPYDCGLCSDHEQHTCIGLIEITNKCDLGCSFCYADSGKGDFLSLDKIEKMMDFYIESEFGNAEVLQISGGEPTMHPEIIKIIELARKKNFKYVLLNTNGLRISKDENFVKNLARFKGKFEIYLQFDSFDDQHYKKSRGKELVEIKNKAIKNLIKYQIPITLVATIDNSNEKEIGKIIDYGMESDYIRGVNLQPLAFFGRVKKNPDIKNRITLTKIINLIEEQSKYVLKNDFVPLPCNVDRVAISYFIKHKGTFKTLTKSDELYQYLDVIENTFAFNANDLLSTGGCCNINFSHKLKKLFPKRFLFKSEEEKIEFINKNLFRISVSSFIDKYNFDERSMKRECVHVITPDLRRIPFSAYNMVHRKNKK